MFKSTSRHITEEDGGMTREVMSIVSHKRGKEKIKTNRGGTEQNRSVMVALARSKTLLCKLTLRVCIAGSERENGGRAGGG